MRNINKDFYIAILNEEYVKIVGKGVIKEILNAFFTKDEFYDNVKKYFGSEENFIRMAESFTRKGSGVRIYFKIPREVYEYIQNRYPKRIISKLAKAVLKQILNYN